MEVRVRDGFGSESLSEGFGNEALGGIAEDENEKV